MTSPALPSSSMWATLLAALGSVLTTMTGVSLGDRRLDEAGGRPYLCTRSGHEHEIRFENGLFGSLPFVRSAALLRTTRRRGAFDCRTRGRLAEAVDLPGRSLRSWPHPALQRSRSMTP